MSGWSSLYLQSTVICTAHPMKTSYDIPMTTQWQPHDNATTTPWQRHDNPMTTPWQVVLACNNFWIRITCGINAEGRCTSCFLEMKTSETVFYFWHHQTMSSRPCSVHDTGNTIARPCALTKTSNRIFFIQKLSRCDAFKIAIATGQMGWKYSTPDLLAPFPLIFPFDDPDSRRLHFQNLLAPYYENLSYLSLLNRNCCAWLPILIELEFNDLEVKMQWER